jgi:hypothetical protein
MTMQRELRQNQNLRTWLRPVEDIFKGTGAYTLPAELVAAKERYDGVETALAQANAAIPPEPYAAAQQLADAVQDGECPTDLGRRQLQAEDEHEQANAQIQILRLVETRIGSELYDAFRNGGEEIVIEHLRPALDETLRKAGKLAPKLKGISSTDALMRAEDEGAHKAWLELERLFPRYRAIRDGYDLVYSAVFSDGVGVSGLDVGDLLAYRNFDQLSKGPRGRVATPTSPAQVMVWLVTESGGVRPEPWLPLPDDIEDALEAARKRVRDQQVSGYQAAQKRTARAQAHEAEEQAQRDKATKSPWRPRPTR